MSRQLLETTQPTQNLGRHGIFHQVIKKIVHPLISPLISGHKQILLLVFEFSELADKQQSFYVTTQHQNVICPLLLFLRHCLLI